MPLFLDPSGLIFTAAVGAASLLVPRMQHQLQVAAEPRSELESIQVLTWRQCQNRLQAAFGHRGYEVSPAPTSSHGAFDLVLRQAGKRILVHCRHWNVWTVRAEPVRELAEAVRQEGADLGLVLTCGSYAEDADRAAREAPIELIDGPGLVELLSEAA
jgi:restriction system protein